MSTLLQVKDLSKSFDGVRAVDDVTLSFEEQKITSLIGPNGAGKTTLFNMLSGQVTPDKGDFVFKGQRLNNGVAPWKRARLGIGRLFQDVRVFHKLTVIENLLVAIPNKLGENPVASIFARPSIRKIEKSNLMEAERWLDFVHLLQKREAKAETLSYGEQKLLAIARMLAGGFDLFLLDEPTAGINPKMVQEILDVVKRLVEQKKTVAIIEHNMSVVAEISDWVFFMDKGKVISSGTTEVVLGDPAVREAYIGL